jgi:pimeloyl-ACP methyl ester carboxylesterase
MNAITGPVMLRPIRSFGGLHMQRKHLALIVTFCLALSFAAHAEDGWITTHDGYKLYYEKIGNGPQRILVPLRIFTKDALQKLAAPNRTLVFYDTRNRGKSQSISDPKAITLQNDVRDLETVRAHFGYKKIIPVGWSYAGMMVMLYAAEHPDRVEKVIQLGPVSPTFGTKYPAEFDNSQDRSFADAAHYERIQQAHKEGKDKSEPQAFCELWQPFIARWVVFKPESVDPNATDLCGMENEWPVNFDKHLEAHFVGSVQNFKFPLEQLKKVKAPVLTIHGKKDRNAAYGAGREWAAIVPNGRLVSFDNAAHALWRDEPQATTRALDEFLRGRWPASAEKVTKNPALTQVK